ITGVADVAEQYDAITRKLMEVQTLASVLAGDLRMRSKLVVRRLQLLYLGIEHPHSSEPIVNVFSAIATGHTARTANGEIDFSSRLIELLRDLRARLSGSNQEHCSIREQRGILVVHGMNLQDVGRDALAESWNPGRLV